MCIRDRFYRYFPKLYNKGYQYAEEHPASFDESSAACRILRRGCKRLRAAILAGGYDAVVCVHLFPALMLTFIQREAPLPIKTMFIATDYTASPSCDRMRLDTCVIPDAALTELFVKNGVSQMCIRDSSSSSCLMVLLYWQTGISSKWI